MRLSSRRRWLKQLRLSGAAAILILIGSMHAHGNDEQRYDGWFFTAKEVGAAYQYQENYGERLRNPLRAGECLFRRGDFSARSGATRFAVPCRFVLEVTRHLKEMIKVGGGKISISSGCRSRASRRADGRME